MDMFLNYEFKKRMKTAIIKGAGMDPSVKQSPDESA